MKTASAWFRSAGRLNLAAFFVVVFAIVAFGTLRASAQKRDPAASTIKESTYAALADAPAKARERKNPFEGDPQAMAAGGKLFEQHCAECHGMKAGGTRKGPSLLQEEVRQATPGTLFWIVSNGVVRARHAGLVEAAGTTALADCHVLTVVEGSIVGFTIRETDAPLIQTASVSGRPKTNQRCRGRRRLPSLRSAWTGEGARPHTSGPC